MKRPFILIPQSGPGHKSVTIISGGSRTKIKCASNEAARALALSLIGVMKKHFPNPSPSYDPVSREIKLAQYIEAPEHLTSGSTTRSNQ